MSRRCNPNESDEEKDITAITDLIQRQLPDVHDPRTETGHNIYKWRRRYRFATALSTREAIQLTVGRDDRPPLKIGDDVLPDRDTEAVPKYDPIPNVDGSGIVKAAQYIVSWLKDAP